MTRLCDIEDCSRPMSSRGLCDRHYAKWRRTDGKPCSIDGCKGGAIARTWCARHYQMWQACGDPEGTTRTPTAVPHGTPQGYNFHKCRCAECTTWRREYNRAAALAKYGLTPESYEQMAQAQGGLCAICGQAPPGGATFSVDHCHNEGHVRGLLCQPCNLALGLMKDDPDRFVSAAAYLLQRSDVLKELT